MSRAVHCVVCGAKCWGKSTDPRCRSCYAAWQQTDEQRALSREQSVETRPKVYAREPNEPQRDPLALDPMIAGVVAFGIAKGVNPEELMFCVARERGLVR